MVRVTFRGPELEGLTIAEPAASVRLLIPSSPDDDLVMPTWNGNEFLLGDGSRPIIRTFTQQSTGPPATHVSWRQRPRARALTGFSIVAY